jgi:GntR family transcriptional regulator/MocR family aminotransferase
MPQGVHIKPKNVISTSTEMSLYIISQLLFAQRCGFGWGFEPLCCNMIFQQSAPLSKQSIDEQGLDVDYIKTRFVKGQFAVFIFVLIVIIPQLFH